MDSGFVYLWKDCKRNKFYLGSHQGLPTDGYVGSGKRFLYAFKNRPHTFRRRILEHHPQITRKALLEREQAWLSLIKSGELRVKYYNEKKVAAGGDTVSTLTEEGKRKHAYLSGLGSKEAWKKRGPKEREVFRLRFIKTNRTMDRSYMSNRNKDLCAKVAKIIHSNGNEEIIRNVADFARRHKLSYGNLKTMLRGGRQKSVAGFRGSYENA